LEIERQHITQRTYRKNALVFLLYWLVAFILYLPAAKAGKVGDYYSEWLDVIQNHSFSYFVFPPFFASLYHFTNTFMYLYYKVFGANPLAWHVLALTFHASNALLLYLIFRKLLTDSALRNALPLAFGAALLFCISPYNSEVVVHEPCFHYTLSSFLQLLILWLSLKFIETQKTKYAIWAGVLFAASSFTIEVFYLTPIFVFSIACYYRYVLGYAREPFRKTMLVFILPQLAIFAIHMVLLNALTNHVVGHDLYLWIDTIHLKLLSALPKYLFHLLCFGRFFPQPARDAVYGFLNSTASINIVGSVVLIILLYAVIRFKKLSNVARLATVLFIWVILCTAIVCMLPFGDMQLIVSDRYAYFMMPFVYLLILLLFHKRKAIVISILALYAIANAFFLLKVNSYWKQSSGIIANLIKTFPASPNKTTLLLNVPQNMNGALMVTAKKSSAYLLMHNYESKQKITAPVYDVAAYNMASPSDGAHVTVLNDSTVNVTLNQWGTWWWYLYSGAMSYENDAYRVDMVDVGHQYNLILKRPPQDYQLLYTIGGEWRRVDWGKKNVEQY
jgi:hypothetical protein